MKIFPTVVITQQDEGPLQSSFFAYFRRFIKENFSEELNSFVSSLYCSNEGILKLDGESLFNWASSGDKKDIYKAIVENDSVLDEFLRSIISGEAGWFSLRSTSEANKMGVFPKSPNICLVFDASCPVYTSLFKVLVRLNDFDPSTPNNCPYITLLLDYDSGNKSMEYRSSVLANLKELDHFIVGESDANPTNVSVYIIDDVTEQGRSIGPIENKFLVFSKLIESLFKNRDLLVTKNWGYNEGRKCCVSTFGLSSIYFPEIKVREFLKAYSEFKELAELINNDFAIKQDRLKLNQEIENFFRKENYDGITERLLVKDGNNIWKEFSMATDGLFSIEKAECCEYETLVIDKQDTRSLIFTNKLLGDVKSRYEQFKIVELSRVYSDLQLVKGSVEREIIDIITVQNTSDINDYIDEKGINYAKIFNAILLGSSSKYPESLFGQAIEFKSLKYYEDGIRRKLVGVRLVEFEREIERIQDEMGDLDVILAQMDNNEVDEKVSPEILEAQKLVIQSRIGEFKKREGEILVHIATINAAFDANFFKDDLKQDFNPPIDDKLGAIEENIIKQDGDLSELYTDKNVRIRARSKFLLYNLIVYPSIILVGSCLLQMLMFYNFEFYRVDSIKLFSSLTIILLLLYYGVSFIRFFKMKNELLRVNNLIEDKLNNKQLMIQNLIKMKSAFDYNNFLFDVGLRALSILKSVEDFLNRRCDEMDNFALAVRTSFEKSKEHVDSLDFSDNEFEAITVSKAQISKLYDSTYPDYSFASDNVLQYSSFLYDFIACGTIDSMLRRLEQLSDEVYYDRIAPIDLNNVIQNKSVDFVTEVPLNTRLEILKNNSMPLLRTSIVTPEMPMTENYLIGGVFKSVKDLLQQRFTSFREGESLEKENIKKIGVLAIKTNFSFAMIEDITSWYGEVEQSKEYAKQTFIDENARNWNLLGRDESELLNLNTIDDLFIILLSQKIVDFKYRKFKSSLSNAIVAENWKDLKVWWHSKRSKDEKDSAIRFQSEIDKMSDEEMKGFLKSLKTLIKEEYFNQSERSIVEDYLMGMSSSMI